MCAHCCRGLDHSAGDTLQGDVLAVDYDLFNEQAGFEVDGSVGGDGVDGILVGQD